MGRIFVTGDTHGGEEYGLRKFNSNLFADGKDLTKDDIVIISGDFGLVWDPIPSKNELYWLNWLNEKPWTTLFIDGNHENHYRLDNLPTVEMFGSPVGQVASSIFHLRRGYVYTISDITFFTFGGGLSIDASNRITDVDWWMREIPNYSEMKRGIDNLDAIGNKVDIIVAHDCPSSITTQMVSDHVIPYCLTDYLQEVVDRTDFVQYFFGHHHQDKRIGEKYMCLYNKIVEIQLFE